MKEKENKDDSCRVKTCKRKQGQLITGLLSVFKIKPKECIRSRETGIAQNIPSAGWGYNLVQLLTAARGILNIKHKPVNGFLPTTLRKPLLSAADTIHGWH